jgi:hypothetical protein
VLPDTSAGRAVAVFVVVLVCGLVAAATMDRLPLWSLLLGTAALTGAYEFTYAEAPPELLTTSLNTATTLFLSVAVGFFSAAVLSLPGGRPAPSRTTPQDTTPNPSDRLGLDDMMEKSK